jgi:hypothetical protein
VAVISDRWSALSSLRLALFVLAVVVARNFGSTVDGHGFSRAVTGPKESGL